MLKKIKKFLNCKDYYVNYEWALGKDEFENRVVCDSPLLATLSKVNDSYSELRIFTETNECIAYAYGDSEKFIISTDTVGSSILTKDKEDVTQD